MSYLSWLYPEDASEEMRRFRDSYYRSFAGNDPGATAPKDDVIGNLDLNANLMQPLMKMSLDQSAEAAANEYRKKYFAEYRSEPFQQEFSWQKYYADGGSAYSSAADPQAAGEPPEVTPLSSQENKRERVYSGWILPFSKNPDGSVEFDSDAGILGLGKRILQSAWSGFTYPGDVLMGRAAPDDIGRVFDFAGLMGGPGLGRWRQPSRGSSAGVVGGKLPPTTTTKGEFFWDTPLYHGTDRSFTGLDLSKAGGTTHAPTAYSGVWSAADPETAHYHARLAAERSLGNEQIYPLVHRASKPVATDLEGGERMHEIAATLSYL